MIINCTNNCQYQKNGNCQLTEIPKFNQIVEDNYSDCMYFRQK